MVAIKDMKMPKNCFDCSFCELPGSLCVCKAGHFTYERKKEFTKKRHPNCPLIEIEQSESKVIESFKTKINSYDKDYSFSREEVLNILERYDKCC